MGGHIYKHKAQAYPNQKEKENNRFLQSFKVWYLYEHGHSQWGQLDQKSESSKHGLLHLQTQDPRIYDQRKGK